MFLENVITAFFIFLILYEIFGPKLREGATPSGADCKCNCPVVATTLPQAAADIMNNSLSLSQIKGTLAGLKVQLNSLQAQPANDAKKQTQMYKNKIAAAPQPPSR
jgi:hypothetical protein